MAFCTRQVMSAPPPPSPLSFSPAAEYLQLCFSTSLVVVPTWGSQGRRRRGGEEDEEQPQSGQPSNRHAEPRHLGGIRSRQLHFLRLPHRAPSTLSIASLYTLFIIILIITCVCPPPSRLIITYHLVISLWLFRSPSIPRSIQGSKIMQRHPPPPHLEYEGICLVVSAASAL
ncbi:hypothetical protein GGS23DRAFT_461917 [Durotheca rogersii]|uniref:uncharacterized protein n=1 Tax=Durotheca rogersii TaxID=419775 RepID=UPI00221FEAA3|nr:uncharacterized protein GGS23DRAFT_461917 [Durotheca rogersii]KAI5864752.1 hypothetical protein GGS23DRAFT_461917 [Durotheca rogersii]